jgi:hypothetical protein
MRIAGCGRLRLHLRSVEVAEKQNGQKRIAVDVPYYYYSFLSSKEIFTCADTTSVSQVGRWPCEGKNPALGMLMKAFNRLSGSMKSLQQ